MILGVGIELGGLHLDFKSYHNFFYSGYTKSTRHMCIYYIYF